VVLFGAAAGDVNRFAAELTPATATHKEALMAWIRSLNARPDHLGTRSAGAYLGWKERDLPRAGLDASLLPPPWLRALHAALELEPDTVFLVTGGASTALRPRSDERRETLERRNEREKERLRRRGIDPEKVGELRRAALAKARRELEEINRQRVAQGKSPFIVSDTKRVFQPDFQQELRRSGFTLVLDTEGWTDARGDPIWEMGVSPHEKVPFTEAARPRGAPAGSAAARAGRRAYPPLCRPERATPRAGGAVDRPGPAQRRSVHAPHRPLPRGAGSRAALNVRSGRRPVATSLAPVGGLDGPSDPSGLRHDGRVAQ
jgi:hypothetical protein